MKEARDFAGLSFPFAAGVAASALLPFRIPDPACLLLPLPVLCLFRCRSRSRFLLLAALVFFLLGIFCFHFASLPGTDSDGPAFAGRLLGRFDSLLGKTGFRQSTRVLLRALLTGRRDALSAATRQMFRAAGASHILALSGLHLGIVYLIITKAMAVFGNSRPAALLRSSAVVAACTVFTLATGACPSMVRALLFVVFSEIARHSPGRRRDTLLIWCAALMIQLALDPAAVLSAGFRLSYLATLGIGLLFPVLDGWYPPGKGPLRKVWSSMALSLSAQAFTAPLVWLMFGTFPKYFLLTNLLALPLTSALIACAAATLVLSAAGMYPEAAVRATDALASALLGTLEIISEM